MNEVSDPTLCTPPAHAHFPSPHTRPVPYTTAALYSKLEISMTVQLCVYEI